MDKKTAIQLETARQLTKVALRCGCLAVLDLAFERAVTCIRVFDPRLLKMMQRAHEEWSAIERAYGSGAALNLDYITVQRMRENADRMLIDPQMFLNADKYRASQAQRPNLYPVWEQPLPEGLETYARN